jgi:hypothetical protein
MTDFQYYFGKRRSLAAIRSFDRRTTRSFRCLDCQRYTFDEYYYMLLDEVWLSANPKRGGMLCIICVERRLGRSLMPEDFKDLPINRKRRDGASEASPRLLSRLRGDHRMTQLRKERHWASRTISLMEEKGRNPDG